MVPLAHNHQWYSANSAVSMNMTVPTFSLPGAFDRLKEFNREIFILDIYLVDLNETEINMISMNARFTIIILLGLFFTMY